MLSVYLYAIYRAFRNIKYFCSIQVAFIFLCCRTSIMLNDSYVTYTRIYFRSYKEHLPADGHNRWPQRVGGYAVYYPINLLICICNCWSYF